MIVKKLKKYDKMLTIKKRINGEKVVERKSPFNSQMAFEVFSIQNQYLGSGSWILRRVSMMDAQKNNIVGEVLLNNYKRRHQKNDRRMSAEIADFMHNGGEQFVN